MGNLWVVFHILPLLKPYYIFGFILAVICLITLVKTLLFFCFVLTVILPLFGNSS
nr:MAG TPA: hypothetical protein [Bacteriophage sp.]